MKSHKILLLVLLGVTLFSGLVSVSADNATLTTLDGYLDPIHRDYMGYVEDNVLYDHHIAIPILKPGSFITAGMIFETKGTGLDRGAVVSNATLWVYSPFEKPATNESLILNIAGYDVSLGKYGGLRNNSSYCWLCENTLYTQFVQFPPRTTTITDVEVSGWDSIGWYSVDVTEIMDELTDNWAMAEDVNLGLVIYGASDPNTEERWLWSNTGANMPYIDIEWTNYGSIPDSGQPAECITYNGWLICPPPSNYTAEYDVKSSNQQTHAVYSKYSDRWYQFVNDENMTLGAGLGYKIIEDGVGQVDQTFPVFLATGEHPFWDFDVALSEDGKDVFVWIARQNGSSPSITAQKDTVTFKHYTVNSVTKRLDEAPEDTVWNILTAGKVHYPWSDVLKVNGEVTTDDYLVFGCGYKIGIGNYGGILMLSNIKNKWNTSWHWQQSGESVYVYESTDNPPNQFYHVYDLDRWGEGGMAVSVYIPDINNKQMSPLVTLIAEDWQKVVNRKTGVGGNSSGGYHTDDWIYTRENNKYYPNLVYGFDVHSSADENRSMIAYCERYGASSTLWARHWNETEQEFDPRVRLYHWTDTERTRDIHPRVYDHSDGSTRIGFWQAKDNLTRREIKYLWDSDTFLNVTETITVSGDPMLWYTVAHSAGNYGELGLDNSAMMFYQMVEDQKESWFLPTGDALPGSVGEGNWTATKGNETLTGDFDTIINQIVSDDPDPLDPSPPGWAETGWFTRSKMKAYVLFGGLAFIFVPMYLFSLIKTGMDKVVFFWVMLFCWLIGFALLMQVPAI